MFLHPDFSPSPYAPLFPEQRWFPAGESLRSTAYERLLPPLVARGANLDGLKIFFNDPILLDDGHEGRNWCDDFQLTLHIQDDVRAIRDTGNLFFTKRR
jgi:hypothetical protein